jgi:hypothetical protein
VPTHWSNKSGFFYAVSTAVLWSDYGPIYGARTVPWAAQNRIVDHDAARHQSEYQCKINPWVGSGPKIDICIEQLVFILGDVPGKNPSRVSCIIL